MTFYDAFSFFSFERFLTLPLAWSDHEEKNYINTLTSLIRGQLSGNGMDDSDRVSLLSTPSPVFTQWLRDYIKGCGCCAVRDGRSPISVPHLAGLLSHLLFDLLFLQFFCSKEAYSLFFLKHWPSSDGSVFFPA